MLYFDFSEILFTEFDYYNLNFIDLSNNLGVLTRFGVYPDKGRAISFSIYLYPPTPKGGDSAQKKDVAAIVNALSVG